VLLQQLIERPVERLVVASSMSIYGEGLYETADGERFETARRDPARLKTGEWDPVDGQGRPLVPVPTPEGKRIDLSSVYALSKYAQEQLVVITAQAYGMAGVALRLFNVFGPGQSLSNPYTGVLAIFASRLANGQRPLVFEDGRQQRDFVHVSDVACAFRLALERDGIAGRCFNIGSGRRVSVEEVGMRLAAEMGVGDLTPEIAGKARAGDIRHCFADISAARTGLGYEPRRFLDDALGELVEWVAAETATDRVAQATRELEARGLVA
jgi:dTDP-L-rhamnose 4-epimerase